MDVLRPVDEDLWVVETALAVLGLEVGRRMTVVRLTGGQLLVHSPAELHAPVRESLDRVGDVRYVVPASNLHGHLFMEQYRAAYPDAELFAAPGLAGRRRDLSFDGLLGTVADPRWSDEIDQAALLGHRLVEEIVFLHRSTRTLIVGDACFNVGPDRPLGIRLWAHGPGGHGGPGPTPAFRLGFRNRRAAREAVDRILAWDFDRIIVGHGDSIESGGRDALRAAYDWL